MTTIIQILMALPLIVYIGLIFWALRYVRQQNLTERDLILWDIIIVLCPIGAVLPFLYFRKG